MRRLINNILFFVFTITLFSCEEVIDVNLNEAEPRLVIEGNITSSLGPYNVVLTTSGGYFDEQAIKTVSGAQVFITDEEGYSEELFEKSPGLYRTDWTFGREGLDYTLEVEVEGITYTATENLPNRVEIQELQIEESIFAAYVESNKNVYDVHCVFEDPVDELNYYRFFITVNGEPMEGRRSYDVSDDELFNGLTYTYSFRVIEADSGDEIKVELQSTGYHTYEYFRSLNDALSGRPGATPYNPVTNLDNDALGYFGAYTVNTETIIAP